MPNSKSGVENVVNLEPLIQTVGNYQILLGLFPKLFRSKLEDLPLAAKMGQYKSIKVIIARLLNISTKFKLMSS